MQVYAEPIAIGLVPQNEYGMDFHLKMSNAAIALAERKD